MPFGSIGMPLFTRCLRSPHFVSFHSSRYDSFERKTACALPVQQTEHIAASLFRAISPRFARDCPAASTCKHSRHDLFTNFTEEGVRFVKEMILCADKAIRPGIMVVETIEAAIFFNYWECYAYEAYCLAAVRYLFVECKVMPTDVLLTYVWHMVRRYESLKVDQLELLKGVEVERWTSVRKMMMDSLWARLIMDEDVDLDVLVDEREAEMWMKLLNGPWEQYVDMHKGGWFAYWSEFVAEKATRKRLDKVYERLHEGQGDTRKSALVDYLQAMLKDHDQHVWKMDRDLELRVNVAAYKPRYDGDKVDEVQREYLQFLVQEELSKMSAQGRDLVVVALNHSPEAAFGHLHGWNTMASEPTNDEPLTTTISEPTTVGSRLEEGLADSTVPNAAAQAQSAPPLPDCSPPPTASPARARPPATPLSTATTTPSSARASTRRKPMQKGAAAKLLKASSKEDPRFAAKREAIARREHVSVAKITDAHPLMVKFRADMEKDDQRAVSASERSEEPPQESHSDADPIREQTADISVLESIGGLKRKGEETAEDESPSKRQKATSEASTGLTWEFLQAVGNERGESVKLQINHAAHCYMDMSIFSSNTSRRHWKDKLVPDFPNGTINLERRGYLLKSVAVEAVCRDMLQDTEAVETMKRAWLSEDWVYFCLAVHALDVSGEKEKCLAEFGAWLEGSEEQQGRVSTKALGMFYKMKMEHEMLGLEVLLCDKVAERLQHDAITVGEHLQRFESLGEEYRAKLEAGLKAASGRLEAKQLDWN